MDQPELIAWIRKQLAMFSCQANLSHDEEHIYQKLNEMREKKICFSPPLSCYELISQKRQILMETYLHQRYLLRQAEASRVKREAELREKIAAVSTELCALRDVGRVAQLVETQRRDSVVYEKEVMSLRQAEWQLMEDELRLTKTIGEIDAKGREQVAKLQDELDKLGAIDAIESTFIKEKSGFVKSFKQEVALVRTAVKSIENSVSKFRAYLREDEKQRRTNAQQLRS